MIIEELAADPSLDDMGLLTEAHYKKQMATVKTILNLDKKGLTVREIGMKVVNAESYVKMVIEEGEEEMNEYWRKMYKMKEL